MNHFFWGFLIFCSCLSAVSAEAESTKLKANINFAYPVRCLNPAECPSWVVGLSTHQGSENPPGKAHESANEANGDAAAKMGVCSGALVAPDIVATNLHCLPAKLSNREQACGEFVKFHFPKTPTDPAETVDCLKVLLVSPPLYGNFLRADYAFLQLANPVSRLPVPVSTDGIADFSPMTIYKVDPTPLNSPSANSSSGTGMEGVIQKIQCKSVQNSIMNPYYRDPLSPLVMLSPCSIIKGNSGSGVIGPDGTLRGLINSYGELLVPETIKKRLKSQVEKFESASGSNMSCIPWPINGSGSILSDACRVSTDEVSRQKLVDELLKVEIQKSLNEINAKVNQQLQSFRLAGSQLFYWKAEKAKLEKDDVESGVMAKAKVRPFCLLPALPSIANYQQKLKSQEVTIPMKISDFIMKEKFDAYLRYQSLVEEKVQQLQVKLTPRDLLQEWNIPVTLIFANEKGNTEEKLRLNLCAKEKK